MGLIRTALIGTLGYLGYKAYKKNQESGGVAFASGQTGNHRDAGPEAMGDKPVRSWNKADEESDESFPASDPPANY
ncbi:hypothetical protein MKP08_04295 [Erythrobacter sp. LQ02-29]|nr:hypothetical protein [Erythrobacter sp. LQ02-29]MCP9221967.1 hypothetical protein [Erythrobacter sp. LQ02-29]QWC56693.1 hypothetical protein F7D01_05915 [Erythrobacter sp. 3-20A1M]